MNGWMTIPEWSDVRQVNVYHREQEKPEKSEKPEGFVKSAVKPGQPGSRIKPEEKTGHPGSLVKSEEKTGQPECLVSPENLHVLVRGTVQLPVSPGAQYEIWVSTDDHYQLWVDGIYQGQGPMSSCFECAFYDRYPIGGDQSEKSAEPMACDAGASASPGQADGKAESKTESSRQGGSRTVTIALHLYYHGRISRSWTSADGRFGLWLSVRERMISKNEFVPDGKGMEAADKKNAQMDDAATDENFREVAHADETWRYQICKAYNGETVGYDTQFLENFDSRLWPEGWEQPEYCVDGTAQNGNGVEDKEKVSDISKETWGYLVSALWADYRMMPRLIQPLEEKKVFASRQWKEVVNATNSQGALAKENVCLDKLPDEENQASGSGHSVYRADAQETDDRKSNSRKKDHSEHDNIKGDADDVRLVLDFGREITGAIVAEAVGPAGAQVLIECGEELEKQNASLLGDSGKERVAAPQVRWDMRCGCAYQEVWTLGDGVSRLYPYDYKGFRYVQLTFPSTVELRQLYAWVRHYPMEEDACTLRCEDRELEQIFEICKNAVRCCSQDAYLDCPTREKGQYLGDALITARSQVWLTGSTELLRKCIGDFILSASISPSLMAVAPGSVMQELADYSLLFPLLPMTDYEFTGDRNFLARSYPAVRKVTESFLIYQRPDGLLENVSALWNLVDWPENLRDHYDFPLTRPIVGEGCHNVINALWYGANKVQEEMEHLLDLPVTGRCTQIAESFRKVFYREEQCLFADSEVSAHCSIHANLYAAYFCLLPEEAEEPYVRILRTPGRVCGALPSYFALKSLAQMGREQDCFDLMTRGDAYGWRNMVREGASASFEAWGKDQK
ncbi:MAG: family 78 glycoside hydrolase catalytic domain, partial [Lachnospiraceae bacterium]|nr:family 78 glycoside hydrolase catalytic domain [Lachnospiraceae bacterium]